MGFYGQNNYCVTFIALVDGKLIMIIHPVAYHTSMIWPCRHTHVHKHKPL